MDNTKPAQPAGSPAKPQAPALPTLAQVPPELASLKRWIGWRYALNKDQTRWVKLPLSPRTARGIGANGKWEHEWTTFDEAHAGAAHLALDGVGFVFAAGDGFVGIDFDDCASNGAFRAIPSQWIKDLDSYGEMSPSGNGVHLIARGAMPGPGNKSPMPDRSSPL